MSHTLTNRAQRSSLISFRRLALNVCVCEADKKPAIELPFAQVLFPRVWAQDDFHTAFQEAELAQVKSRRQQEYNSFQQR